MQKPITLCFTVTDNIKKSDHCLAYYDKNNEKWKCEDKCLSDPPNTSASGDDNTQTFCGDTDHLTDFSILFKGSDNNNECGDGNEIDVFAWLALAFCIAAILLCIIVSLSFDLYKRYDTYSRNRHIDRAVSLLNSSNNF